MAEALVESLRSVGSNVIEFEGSPERKPLFSTLTNVLENGSLSDVVLCTRGGELKVHRLILLTQCLKLQEKILNTEEKQIFLDVDVSALRRAVEFVYINKVSVPETDLEKVANVANILGIKELWQMTMKAFLGSKDVTLENCFKYWSLAFELNEPLIESRVMKFALKNFGKLKRSSEFKALQYKLVKEYLIHSDLNVRSEEDRLSSTLAWVREDTKTRASRLPTLLKALPLRKMAAGFLDHLLDDPLFVADVPSHTIIQETLAGISDTDRHKGDVPFDIAPKTSHREKCHIIVAPYINGIRVSEVKAVCLSQNFRVVSICRLPTIVPEGVFISSCMVGDMLYVSGLGDKKNGIWQISMKDLTRQKCGKLITPRCNHAMAVGENGKVYILGGSSTRVEVLDTTTHSIAPAGDLNCDTCSYIVCISHGEKLLACGGVLNQAILHTYDVNTGSVEHIPILSETVGILWGILRIKDHVVIMGQLYTAVGLISDMLRGLPNCLQKSNKYTAPNMFCTLCLSADESHIVLLGSDSKSKHRVYQASVNDVINNTGTGWQPVHNTLFT